MVYKESQLLPNFARKRLGQQFTNQCKNAESLGGLPCSGCRHLSRWQLHWENGLRRMWFSCGCNAIENPMERCSRYEEKCSNVGKGDFDGLEDFYAEFDAA